MVPIRFARTLLSALFLLSIAGAIVCVSVGLAVVSRIEATLPPVSSVLSDSPQTKSILHDKDGAVVEQFGEQNRTVVPLSEVPLLVRQAFVAAEDHDFYRHKGIDPFAIARALVSDIRNRGTGRRPLGASTITQQVIKNTLTGDDRTLRRKLREALLALRLEREGSKDRILEIYLNRIYLGQGAYGVAEAAKTWFGKPLAGLTLAEAAFLGGLPKAPGQYDPVKHPEAAQARRHYVLSRMVEDGVVDAGAARAADASPLPVPAPHSYGGEAGGWFGEEARREVIEKMGADALYKGGLDIRTSMDPRLQELAEKSLREGLLAYDARHGWRGPLESLPKSVSLSSSPSWRAALSDVAVPDGADEDWYPVAVLGFKSDGSALTGDADGQTDALGRDGVKGLRPGRAPRDFLRAGDVVLVSPGADGTLALRQVPEVQGGIVAMDAATGRVLAVAGGYSHAQGAFDRATQSYRQVGSTFKPFIYLTAFGAGFTPTSPVLDLPIVIDPGDRAPLWRPGADGGSGWGLVTARRALENSRNLASVRLLYGLGLDAVGKTARDFGVYEALPNYAAALGARESTVLRLTAGYAAIANGGHRVTPTFVDAIYGADGHVIARRPDADTATSLADPIALAQLRSVLEGVVRRGTAASALSRIDLPIAGKTGTTNDNVDAWFVGFTPDIAVGVHVGFDMPAPLGESEMGGSAAAPVFGAFVKGALALYPPSAKTFPLPPGAHTVLADPVSGLPSKSGIAEVVRDTALTGQ